MHLNYMCRVLTFFTVLHDEQLGLVYTFQDFLQFLEQARRDHGYLLFAHTHTGK
jgi:hypothetical protein